MNYTNSHMNLIKYKKKLYIVVYNSTFKKYILLKIWYDFVSNSLSPSNYFYLN